MVNETKLQSPYGQLDDCLKITNEQSTEVVYNFGDILELDREYTFSCWFRADSEIQISIQISNERSRYFPVTSEWQKVSFTASANTATSKKVFFTIPANNTLYAYEGMLELGNIASDFKPSEKDIENVVTTLQTNFTVQQGKIESLIKETTIDNGDGTTTSLKDAYNQTKQTVEGNKTTIANVQTKVNTLTGDVESMDSRITNVEATAEGIKTTVSKIRVGTRNLIYNTDFSIDQTSNWKTFNANATISSNSGYMKVVQTAANSGCYAKYAKGFEKDKDYVVSFVAYASEQCSLTYNYIMSSNTSTVGNQPLGSGVSISTEPTLYVIKFTANNDFPENSSIMLGANKAVTWYFKEMMCEEGTINSSWTVAPEDVDSSINDVDTKADNAQNTADTAKTTATNAKTIAQQTASKFSWIVNSGTSATDFTLTDRTASLVADYINLNGKVTFSGLDSSAQNKINTAQSTANTANSKIDNLQIGGRNYFAISTFEMGGMINGNRTASSFRITNANHPFSVTPSTKYTLNICDWSEFLGVRVGIHSCDEDGNFLTDSNWKQFYNNNPMEFTTASNVHYLKFVFSVSTKGTNVTTGGTEDTTAFINVKDWLRGCLIKIEKGNKSTDWTPAPEDKANQSIIDNWAKDSVVNGETVINGGYIKTNTIKTDQLAVDDIFATGSAAMNIINAQEINANRITSGQLSAERINVYGLSVLNKDNNQQTFNITNNGEVTIKGSVSSSNYNIGKTGWAINNDGTAEFNDIIARGSVITNDGGIANSGSIRFWAGTSYEERESAPWIVYSDGSMKATQGEFSGVFSGTVDIGNIRIIDPSSASGGDALLTIQDGGSGLKRVQLTDSNSSIFAQDLIISNNTYSPMVTLKQDGTALFDRGINIGDSKDNSDNVILNKTSLIISNKELTTTSTGFLINSNLDVGSSNDIAHLTVHGDTISDSMTLSNELNFGGVVKFTTTSNGINIDFVE